MRPNRLVPLLLLALASFAAAGCTVAGSDDSGEKVSPRGSAYSYLVPQGFQKVDPVKAEGTPADFVTSVAAPETDQDGAGLIVGELSGLPAVRDAADLRALLPQFEPEIHQVERALGASISSIAPAKFPGHFAARWVVAGVETGPFPGLDAETTLIFTPSGDHAVEVTCRAGHSAEERRLIDRACAELLHSLRLD